MSQRDRGEKILQYVMLALLLVLVFVVFSYAGAHRKGADAGQSGGGPDTGKGNAENVEAGSGAEKENTGEADGSADSAEKETEESRGTIVLDAGHGGMDPGVSGAGGVPECELNLAIARKLETLLAKEGYRVVQTRPTEAGLYDEEQTHKKAQDMQRRCAVIEAAQPLLTVSIHQNSYPDSTVSGPQVFYFTQSKEGERLASCIQSHMNEQLAPEAPKSHKGNESYYILRRSAGTTVIVECGFLTNPAEEAKLREEAYQDKVAHAIRDGVLAYLAAAPASASAE